MRCCVQNCLNDNAKKTRESHGITFHKIPRDPNQSAAWLKALAAAGCRTNNALIVCSEHFLPEDFDETLPNQRRVKSGVVPTVMTPINHEEFKVCRVCLALDVKMYDLGKFKLSKMFQNITGISVIDETESTLHHVCWECAARLTAASAFRDKALLSDTLLKDLVNINKEEIEQLKQYYSQLKPTLTIQTVFTTADIDCGDALPENQLHRPRKRKVYERKTRLTTNKEEEIDLHEEEPLIGAPVKTEVEFDPIAENVRIKDEKSEAVSELTNFDDGFTPNEGYSVGEITVERIDNNELNEDIEITNATNKDKIDLVEESAKKPKLDLVENTSISDEPTCKDTEKPIEPKDSDIVLAEDNVENNPTLDDIDESSSEEDTQSLAKLASVKKAMTKTRSTVKDSNRRAISVDLRQLIIKHKQAGVGTRKTARLLGITRNTVWLWWRRWLNEGHLSVRKRGGEKPKITTDEQDKQILDRVMQSPVLHTRSLAKEFGITTSTLRRRLRTAGFKPIKPEAYVPPKRGRQMKVDEDLKERIMTMKQNGVGVTDMAREFEVPRTTIYHWWSRWCKENNIETSNKDKNDITEEGPSKTEDVKNKNTLETPKKLSTKKSSDSNGGKTEELPTKLLTRRTNKWKKQLDAD